jgi:hypothetical protein
MVREIELTQGKVALVDDEDYEVLSKYNWRVRNAPKTCYARSNLQKNNVQIDILMHRVILQAPNGLETDHIDGNGLNNQKYNLRIVTRRGNAQNRHVPKTSKFPGVAWYKPKNRWESHMQINGKNRHIGYFDIEEEAYTAYCVACKVLANE